MKIECNSVELELTDTIIKHPTLLGNFLSAFVREDGNILFHVKNGAIGMQVSVEYNYDDVDITRQVLVAIVQFLRQIDF